MVDKSNNLSNGEDGVIRTVKYAAWRSDLSPTPGHSRELISVRTEPQYVQDLETRPHVKEDQEKGLLTFLDYFERHAKERPNVTYLGTRAKILKDGEVTGYG